MIQYSNGIITFEDGAQLHCDHGHMLFGVNELPSARFVVGADPNIPSSLPAQASIITKILMAQKRGSEVIVTFDLAYHPDNNEGKLRRLTNQKVFKGLYQGWSNMMIDRQASEFIVFLDHWFASFNQSILTDAYHGRGMGDAAVPASYDGGLVAYLQGKSSPTKALEDLWKNLILPEFQKLLAGKSFGTSVQSSANTLSMYDKSELPLKFSTCDNALDLLMDIKRSIYMIEDNETSLWQKWTRLAARYYFGIVPRINDFSVAPLMPTLANASSKGSVPYLSKMCLVRGEMITEDVRMRDRWMVDALAMLGGIESLPASFDYARRNPVSSVNRVQGSNTPIVRLIEKAPIISGKWWSMLTSAKKTLGFSSTNPLYAAGYISKPGGESFSANTEANTYPGQSLKALAETEYGYQLYKDRAALLHCRLTLDYSPGSHVTFELPVSPDVLDVMSGRASNKPAYLYHGFIQRVCVSFDGSNRGGTWLLLTHTRTNQEQQALTSSKHPMYQGRWTRSPLISLDQFTANSETTA